MSCFVLNLIYSQILAYIYIYIHIVGKINRLALCIHTGPVFSTSYISATLYFSFI